jgi:hypothetical protein
MPVVVSLSSFLKRRIWKLTTFSANAKLKSAQILNLNSFRTKLAFSSIHISSKNSLAKALPSVLL